METTDYDAPQLVDAAPESSAAGLAGRPHTAESSTGRKGSPTGRCPVAIIGAGPYGLSAAAHLTRTGVAARVFGEPMESWARHMPVGMMLRSRWEASNIADPGHALGLESYEAALGLERAEPVPLARFVEYGRWFQARAVPGLDRRRVTRVAAHSNGFRVELEDGENFLAERVVVAAGIVPFAWRPPQFAGLPPSLVSHSADHRDLSVFEGRRVAVVGGGQSAFESAALLAEAGADVEIVARGRRIRWLSPPEKDRLSADAVDAKYPGLLAYAQRKTALGGPLRGWLAAWPDLFRWLPYGTRARLVSRIIMPRIAGWLRPRLSGVPITTGRTVTSVARHGDQLALGLDDASTRVVDHCLVATGYRIDVARYAFLAPELVGRVRTRGGSPVLTAGFESSVPGLHFLGAPAGRSFGPVLHFVCGTWASARGLTRAIVGRRAPRGGFTW
jgi:cation diffusion facilitator CzcD-associated flavoprotein CzcO